MVNSAARSTRAMIRRGLPGWVGTRPAVRRSVFQVLRVARKLTYRSMARGDKPAALTYSGLAYRRFPSDPFAVRLHARALITEPISAAECERAMVVLAPALVARPDDESLINVFEETVQAMLVTQLPRAAVARHVAYLPVLCPVAGPPRVKRIVERQHAFGHRELVGDVLDALDGQRNPRAVALLSHSIACLIGDVERAERIADELVHEPWMTPEDECELAVERAMRHHRPDTAVVRLEALRPQRDAWYSLELVAAYRAIGRHDRVLEYLDATRHGIAEAAVKVYRYDAHIALGELESARAVATSIQPDELGDIRLLRIMVDDANRGGPDGRASMLETMQAFEASRPPTINRVAEVLAALFECGLLDEMELVGSVVPNELLGPSSRVHLARLHYARRRFSQSLEMLDALQPTNNRWDAEKLRARILLEQGDFAGAIEHRGRFVGTTGDIDEVLYHALLQGGQFREAFALFSSPAEQGRLAATFGERAEPGAELGHVGRRFLIAQAGPGDEITLASVYSELRTRSQELFATCDPRLLTLLSRSFPDICFLPVERLRPGSVGFLAAGRPRRAENALFDLLTVEAMEVASCCDGVVLGKSVQHLAVEPETQRPFGEYLVPDPRLVDDLALRWGAAARPTGIVWRSELRSPMRDIHYLEVGELAPLLERDANFVCLQHDATDSEREQLKVLTNGRVHFADDLDLRNDLESAAALSAGLAAVVGVGTTALELAAAVGTPVVMMQPTHFGTWRAMDSGGQDFWHRSLRVVRTDQPWNRKELVAHGALVLDELLAGS